MSPHLSPFVDQPDGETEDRLLVERAKEGDRDALEALVRRHQGFIYNVVLRMVCHAEDAEDRTQEILVKVVTKLSTFEGRSSFRTWLYRIVTRHVLNMKRGREETQELTFSRFGSDLDSAPDLDLPDPNSVPVDLKLLVDEARIGCTSAMLLCLSREQRLVFILGEICGASDRVGGELLDVSRANFRQKLTRARRDLCNFMNDKCGLVNQANPCRCAKKTRAFIKSGHVDPENLIFAREKVIQIRRVAEARDDRIETYQGLYADLYRQHPFQEPPDVVGRLRSVIESPLFRETFELEA